eukprot:357052-Chlamydomonas_euryale.AAC.4
MSVTKRRPVGGLRAWVGTGSTAHFGGVRARGDEAPGAAHTCAHWSVCVRACEVHATQPPACSHAR